LSDAVASGVMVLLTVLPLIGELSETVGGVVSAVVLFTVTVLVPDAAEFPAASYAFA
jgi:hypothetical protein